MYKPGYLELSPEEVELVLNGAIYVSGRDKNHRPILVINTQKIQLLNVEIVICFLRYMVFCYMYYNGVFIGQLLGLLK